MDEVECITANLIYKKYVKGYISHKNQVGRHAGIVDCTPSCTHIPASTPLPVLARSD